MNLKMGTMNRRRLNRPDLNDFFLQFSFYYPNCRVPQLMSVLLTEFMSAFKIFSVFVEIDFVVVD